MTDEEFEAALAEYRRNPGTEPNSFGYRELPALFGLDPRTVILPFQEMEAVAREGGATFFRYSIIRDAKQMPPYQPGLYLEGWDKEPYKQAPFPFSFPQTSAPTLKS